MVGRWRLRLASEVILNEIPNGQKGLADRL